MKLAGRIQGVEPQLPGMSGALPSAAPVRRELLRDRYSAMLMYLAQGIAKYFAMPRASSGKRFVES